MTLTMRGPMSTDQTNSRLTPIPRLLTLEELEPSNLGPSDRTTELQFYLLRRGGSRTPLAAPDKSEGGRCVKSNICARRELIDTGTLRRRTLVESSKA
nr:hypothetical protein GCM10017611_19270 [Rhodococcus wratislaviensis]